MLVSQPPYLWQDKSGISDEPQSSPKLVIQTHEPHCVQGVEDRNSPTIEAFRASVLSDLHKISPKVLTDYSRISKVDGVRRLAQQISHTHCMSV